MKQPEQLVMGADLGARAGRRQNRSPDAELAAAEPGHRVQSEPGKMVRGMQGVRHGNLVVIRAAAARAAPSCTRLRREHRDPHHRSRRLVLRSW